MKYCFLNGQFDPRRRFPPSHNLSIWDDKMTTIQGSFPSTNLINTMKKRAERGMKFMHNQFALSNHVFPIHGTNYAHTLESADHPSLSSPAQSVDKKCSIKHPTMD